MRASDKDFSVFLHLAQGILGDIRLDSDRYCNISIAMKASLWLTAHTKLSRSKTITNKNQKHTDR